METHFQLELKKLKEDLLKMAGLAERAISNAVESLVKRDTGMAQKTISDDEAINKMEILIDEECLRLLALYQPMAADLRFITSAIRISSWALAQATVSIARRRASPRYFNPASSKVLDRTSALA